MLSEIPPPNSNRIPDGTECAAVQEIADWLEKLGMSESTLGFGPRYFGQGSIKS
jgi:hypothetical protein